MPVPDNLLPLMPVDERSIAAVICQPTESDEPVEGAGAVVRWHLDDISADHQAAVLDTDAWSYARSVAEELNSRAAAMKKVDEVTEKYRRQYVENEARPKAHVPRPVQLACQNVILGLSVFAYDSSFDGLRVPAWATCEVPHVATHEANRALTALMLCDAYASGGTMEVRFGRRVPASLRRFGRTVGVWIADDADALTPSQSRELFLAVTPMPDSLRARVERYILEGVEAPERLCFTLLAQIWREIELDFLLATSHRTPSILAGGARHDARATRMAESEVCRATLLAGMLFRRLNALDTAGGNGEARVFEDTSVGVTWEVLPLHGAVLFDGVPGGLIPWQRNGETRVTDGGRLIAVPRAHPTDVDVSMAASLAETTGAPVVLVVPADRTDVVDCQLPVLACPDRVSELDAAIEGKLLASRIARS